MLVMTGLVGDPAQARERDVLVLRSCASESMVAEGDSRLLERKACPASTFKILIAWAALEEGIASPGREIRCSEKHLGGKPRDLDLHKALVLSGNEYFRRLAGELGRERLERWVLRSGLIEGPLPKAWIDKALANAIFGGTLTITPSALHALTRRLADGSLGTRPEVTADLVGALEWPCPDPSVKLYGKTGVYNGAVWFTGFGRKDGKTVVITVFKPGTLSDRPAVIARFYRCFGLSWTQRLLEDW